MADGSRLPGYGGGAARGRALAAPLLLLVAGAFVATGRWGAYLLSPPQAPVGDIIAFCAAVTLIARGRGGQRLGFSGLLGISVSGAVIARALEQSGEYALPIALRDAYPFFALPVVCVGIARALALAEVKQDDYLTRVLLAHSAWAIPVAILQVHIHLMVGPGVELFAIRSDYDGLACLVAAGWFLLRAQKRIALARVAYLSVAILNFAAFARSPSRAALGAGTLLVVGMVGALRTHRGRWRIGVLRSATGVALALVLAVFSGSAALARTGLQGDGGTGRATSQARALAWQRVTAWTRESEARLLFGAGFGVNPVTESGAVFYLSGSETVRSPHNFFLNLFTRLGVVGAAVFTLWLILILGGAWTAAVIGCHRDRLLYFLAALSILVIGLLGVVVEAPFGVYSLCTFIGLAQSAREEGLQKLMQQHPSSPDSADM